MVSSNQPSRILLALDALKALDRDRAILLLNEELRDGPSMGERWKSFAALGSHIGEIDITLEAARRYALTQPVSLDRQLHYWGELASFGRADQALEQVGRLPSAQSNHPIILHFLGTIAGERGDFAGAEDYYRRALSLSPSLCQTWFALAMIKAFVPGDSDLLEMERLRPSMARVEPALQARFLYGLAKAWHDCGDFDRAFALYSEGAELRRINNPFDSRQLSNFADRLIAEFTCDAMEQLVPSGNEGNRVIFVNGLPRSGSTLVEQILTSHSQVADGGEINLLRAALIPTGDYSFSGALAYQQRVQNGDPWRALADHYYRMVAMRFGGTGRIVDKTLSQSHFMGLLLHMLPDARIVWMRRDPQDAALSCFRTFFSSPLSWSWSLKDIGEYFAIEDRLYNHWTTLFPDRILTVPYEDLAGDPVKWIPRIMAHAGLPDEPQLQEFHKTKRSVRTASVQQVRAPISTNRIGLSQGYARYMDAFRKSYRA